MRHRIFTLGVCAVLSLALFGCAKETAQLDALETRAVILPNGKTIRAEVMIHPNDMMRGMMFRDSLAPDRGMLFIHTTPGQYKYWMYQVRIPLDIIWMDENRRIVELSPNTPPCQTKASECPSYGGNQTASLVLELAAGMIGKHNLGVGDVLRF